MKRFYSVEAFSERDVSFPEYMVALGKGVNVFTLTAEDIQETLKQIAAEGVRIDKVHALDGMDTVHFLPGETPDTKLLDEG